MGWLDCSGFIELIFILGLLGVSFEGKVEGIYYLSCTRRFLTVQRADATCTHFWKFIDVALSSSLCSLPSRQNYFSNYFYADGVVHDVVRHAWIIILCIFHNYTVIYHKARKKMTIVRLMDVLIWATQHLSWFGLKNNKYEIEMWPDPKRLLLLLKVSSC